MRIRQALERKLPKLRAASAAAGYASVLVLESNDIALSNAFVIADAFAEAARGLELPDLVFLAETDASPPAVWVFKDCEELLPNESHYNDWPAHDKT